jgi:hypothetical protein
LAHVFAKKPASLFRVDAVMRRARRAVPYVVMSDMEQGAKMRMMKFAAVASLAGALAAGVAIPTQAKDGRNTTAAIGFGAGVLAGAAAARATTGYYYAPRYHRGYAYQPGYAFEPGYGYAEPEYGAYAYAPRGYGYNRTESCATDGTYGKRADYAACQ